MVVGIIVLSLILVGLVVKILVDHRRTQSLIQQLVAINDYDSRAMVKNIGSERHQNELIMQINQLVLTIQTVEAQKRKLDRHNRAMMASIAHDFRTPLTSILGYVQILQTTDDPDMREKAMEVIEGRIASLSILIEDFYAVSLLESNEYPVHLQQINPKLVLQDQLAQYYTELQHHFMDLMIDIDDRSVFVMADLGVLIRIYSNLIKNALLHGDSFLRIRAETNATQVVFTMSNRVEKPIADVERLFERSYRSDFNRSEQSSGLGLSIAHELTQRLNGSLSAAIDDQVLTFTLALNRAEEVERL